MPKAGFADWDEDDAFDDLDERSLRRGRRRLPWLRILVLSSLSIAGLVYIAQQRQQQEQAADSRPVPPSVLIAPDPAWKPVSPSPGTYALERSASPVTAEARQHTSGAREDTLILGAFGEGRHARIILAQGSVEPERSFFVDLVRRAASAGLSVTRNAQSRMVPTKFGPVEAAAVTLAGTVEQECQAFRFSQGETGFGFQGWLCSSGAGSGAMSEDMGLACFIDGIALAGGSTPSLKAVLARAERSRIEACSPVARTSSVGPRAPRRP
ncbi:hypothetical protein [Microvirga roseola]|uniref:hypothetical protein n=1 Tax=Microvirga roseola TaxID=2883126 RepID=UPI001E299601|nr:hypothetical protein [Microvirga roseola]